MKTSTTIKIIIITFFLILSKVSVGQTSSTSKKEVKKSTSTHNVKKSNQSPSLAGSKRGILPTMTVNTVSKTYLV